MEAHIGTGEVVKVYRNLHNRTGVGYSIKHAKRNRVISKRGGVQCVKLENVTFWVSEKTRQRTIREGKKYVHAYAVGTMKSGGDYENAKQSQTPREKEIETGFLNTFNWHRVSYNPFRGPDFTVNGRPLAGADRAQLCATGMWVFNPRFKNQ